MSVFGIFRFARTGPVALEQADQLVRILNKITQKYSRTVNDLIARLEALDPLDKNKTTEIESQVNHEIIEWNTKVRKLGAIPKGLWLVDIDAGDGYYCWKFPEVEIGYWHDYQSGFMGRISLAEKENARRSSSNQLTSGPL